MKIVFTGSADMVSEKMSASCRIDDRILLDLPGGALKEMKRNGQEPLLFDHVLITHMHGDHMLDLPIFILEKVKTDGKLTVCAEKEIMEDLMTLSRLSFRTSLTPDRTGGHLFRNTEDDFQIADYQVKRVQVSHGTLPHCSGYLVRKGGVTAGFTGDACLCENVFRMAELSDILVCDCDLIAGNDKHMGIDDLKKIREKVPGCRIAASHMKDETRAQLLYEKPDGIEIAEDGMVIEIKKTERKSSVI